MTIMHSPFPIDGGLIPLPRLRCTGGHTAIPSSSPILFRPDLHLNLTVPAHRITTSEQDIGAMLFGISPRPIRPNRLLHGISSPTLSPWGMLAQCIHVPAAPYGTSSSTMQQQKQFADGSIHSGIPHPTSTDTRCGNYGNDHPVPVIERSCEISRRLSPRHASLRLYRWSIHGSVPPMRATESML